MGKALLNKNKKFIPTRSNPSSIKLRKKTPTLLPRGDKHITRISNQRRQILQLKKQRKLNAEVKQEPQALPFVNAVKIEISDVLQDSEIVSHYQIDDGNNDDPDMIGISNEKSVEVQEELRLVHCGYIR